MLQGLIDLVHRKLLNGRVNIMSYAKVQHGFGKSRAAQGASPYGFLATDQAERRNGHGFQNGTDRVEPAFRCKGRQIRDHEVIRINRGSIPLLGCKPKGILIAVVVIVGITK